jgi:hypothetical protein
MRGESIEVWTRRALAEGIGTFFLVLIGPGAVMVDAYSAVLMRTRRPMSRGDIPASRSWSIS